MTSDPVARAHACWNGSAPDWVLALAGACERETHRDVAARVGYSHTVVGQVIRNKYPKSLERIETAVRGALMSENVECPVLGEIGKQVCVRQQARKDSALGANPDHVKLFRACRDGCPHSFIGRKSDADT